jgi:hypothetical protein
MMISQHTLGHQLMSPSSMHKHNLDGAEMLIRRVVSKQYSADADEKCSPYAAKYPSKNTIRSGKVY